MREAPTKGISKHWTPAQEERYSQVLAGCQIFAQRDLIMSIRDCLKYDGRSKEGKRAKAQAKLRIATASDKDLEKMAVLDAALKVGHGVDLASEKLKTLELVAEELERLKALRALLRLRGIKRSDLECR